MNDGNQFISFPAIVDRLAASSATPALIVLAADGDRQEVSFSQVVGRSAALAAHLGSLGVERRDVVLTLVGNRPEWVYAMLACWRMGAVVLPCNEQLRSKDLRLRIDRAKPSAIVCDERNFDELSAAGWTGPTVTIPDEAVFAGDGIEAVPVAPTDPAMMMFTSGTTGEAKPVIHSHGCLPGQQLQAQHWFDAHPGEIAWCTAASGWSKSARNVFLTPWLCGATALLHDARFDPAERLNIVEREGVNVLCMAPTEYRVIARREPLRRLGALRHCVSAGEALNSEIVDNWREGVGVEIYDGYGQTETGAITAMPLDAPVRPGSMGKPMPGISVEIIDGELCIDPATVPTFFSGYGTPGELEPPQLRDHDGRMLWHTGDRVEQDADGFLWFESRNDDIILSAGYRIGPFEVESALISHPAVAEAAAVAAPDSERGAVVRAVIVLKDGYEAGEQLAGELKEHVKQTTAPYKYPRIVEFTDALPKTQSGKIRRAALRGES